jgi:hypothetical protein
MQKVTVTQEVDAQQFFEELLGASPFSWEWWTQAEYDEGYDWDTYPTDWGKPFLTVSILDPDDENEERTVTRRLCLNDLVRAHEKSGHKNWQNHDTNTADMVLQWATFGEYVYA